VISEEFYFDLIQTLELLYLYIFKKYSVCCT